MKIKGIIFDKDGTLIEFSDLWRLGFEELLKKYNLTENEKREIKIKVGIEKDQSIIENSIIASGTMEDLFKVFSEFLGVPYENISDEITEFFFDYIKNNPDMIKETCDIKALFKALKENNIKIGVVTSDNYLQSKLCFEILKLEDYIEFLATGDRFLSKPDPQALDSFCEMFNLNRKEIMVVGDSEKDMLLGKKAGIAVGVLSGVGTKKMLEKTADIIINTPCEVLNLIK